MSGLFWHLWWHNMWVIGSPLAVIIAGAVVLYYWACRAWRLLDRWADRGIDRAQNEADLEALINATSERVGKHRAVWEGSLDDLDAPQIHEITDAAWRQP